MHYYFGVRALNSGMDTIPRRTRVRGAEKDCSTTAREILRAAIHDFDENGYSRASIAEIAKHAGISKSLVTYYFPTKSSLATAILNQAYPEGVFMGVDRQAADPLEAILDAVSHAADCVAHGSLARVALKLHAVPELQHTERSVAYYGWLARISDYLDEARRSALIPAETDTEAESRLIVAGLAGITTLAIQTGDFLSLVTDAVTITRDRIDFISRVPPIPC